MRFFSVAILVFLIVFARSTVVFAAARHMVISTDLVDQEVAENGGQAAIDILEPPVCK